MIMRLGIVGLGRMGGNMAERLLRAGHQVVVWNRSPGPREEAARKGAEAAETMTDLVARLTPPRIVWVMLPAGEVTEQALETLLPALQPGDILIEGGNSNYKDSKRRAAWVEQAGVHYLDAGTSGGIWGLTLGYCVMVGGSKEAFDIVEPILRDLAPPDGYAHVGPSGAGHFAKMVHNGIEYGMLQAYGEGFEILKASEYSFDLRQLSHLWNQGSVVRSWLLELAERAFASEGNDLSNVRGYVEDSGEGRWTVQEAIDRNVPAPVLTLSLLARFASRQPESFSAQVIAALRREFGGHAVKTE